MKKLISLFLLCALVCCFVCGCSDLAEIKLYYTEEEAKEAADLDNYHIAKWLVAVMFGEGRWLKSGQYGKIEYSSYNSKLLKPLKELMK